MLRNGRAGLIYETQELHSFWRHAENFSAKEQSEVTGKPIGSLTEKISTKNGTPTEFSLRRIC